MQPSGSLLLGPPPLPERVEKSRLCSTQAAEKGVLPMWTDSEYISEPISGVSAFVSDTECWELEAEEAD